MAERKKFSPIEKACVDSFRSGWLGDRHFDLEKFIVTCKLRGLIGEDVWKDQKDLSMPLRLFEKETKGIGEEQIDVLLGNLADTIKFDPNLLKRHFYAIRFDYEDQFLADIGKKEKQHKKFEQIAEEAETEIEDESELEAESESEGD